MPSTHFTRAAKSTLILVIPTVLLGSGRPSVTLEETCGNAAPPVPTSYSAYFGQQRMLSTDSPKWSARIVSWQPSAWPPQEFMFEVKNKKTGKAAQLTFDAWGPSRSLQVNQIDEISIFEDKLLIIGRAGANSSEANIVELPTGKVLDRFSCFMPSVSPDGRFVAFLKSFPGHPGPVSVSAEYLVYSLVDVPASRDAHLGAVYPPGVTNQPGGSLVPGLESPVHWISSERLFWIDEDTLAFTDHYPGEAKLVVVSLGTGVQVPLVHTETLPTGELVDLEHCRSNYSLPDIKSGSLDSSGLIRVKSIARAPQDPGHLCLRFEPSPCLTRKELLVKAP